MKLSDLKKLVASIEGNAGYSNPDPDVRFYMPRPEGWVPTEKQSAVYAEFEPTDTSAWEHKVVATTSGTVQRVGDFSIPVLPVNFYK